MMKEENRHKKDKLWVWSLWAIALVVLIFSSLWWLTRSWYPIPSTAAEFGDSFGAANAIFSAFAFAAIVISLVFQKKELEIQIQEVRNSNFELKQSNKYLGKQINILAKSNNASVVIGLFNEFRGKKWTRIRKQMNEAKKEGRILNFDEVREYSHFLNHFGFLLEHDYIDIRPLYETFGKNVMDFWHIYKTDIRKERDFTNSVEEYRPYQYHLEYLDKELRNYFETGSKHINDLMGYEK